MKCYYSMKLLGHLSNKGKNNVLIINVSNLVLFINLSEINAYTCCNKTVCIAESNF